MIKPSELEKLEKQFQKNPKSRLFFPIAEAYRNNGEYEQAIEIYRIGLDTHPKYISARVSLGRALIAMNKLDEALSELELVIKMKSDNWMAQKLLAEIYIQKGDHISAIKRYEEILELNPSDSEVEDKIKELTFIINNEDKNKEKEQTIEITKKSDLHYDENKNKKKRNLESTIEEKKVDLETRRDKDYSKLKENETDKHIIKSDILDEETKKEFSLNGIDWDVSDNLEDEKKTSKVNNKEKNDKEIVAFDWEARDKEKNIELNKKAENDKTSHKEKVKDGKKNFEEDILKEEMRSGYKTNNEKIILKEKDEMADVETKTIAELYEKQGHYKEAIEIYRKILDEKGPDEEIKQKIKNIEDKISKSKELIENQIIEGEQIINKNPNIVLSGLEKFHKTVNKIKIERQLT